MIQFSCRSFLAHLCSVDAFGDCRPGKKGNKEEGEEVNVISPPSTHSLIVVRYQCQPHGRWLRLTEDGSCVRNNGR
jgi:hypothetical protein